MLKIENLTATVKDKQILNNLNIEVKAGEVHAIMGPNGSGKSTLANVIAGRDGYEVTSGSITYLGKDLLGLSVEDRACEGIFLAFQYPVEIPGVSNIAMLKVAVNSIRKYRGEEEIKAGEFLKLIKAKAAAVLTALGRRSDLTTASESHYRDTGGSRRLPCSAAYMSAPWGTRRLPADSPCRLLSAWCWRSSCGAGRSPGLPSCRSRGSSSTG